VIFSLELDSLSKKSSLVYNGLALAGKGHALYTIDLVTILQMLREFRQTGTLRADLPSGLPRLKQPCFVITELVNGEMTACYVKDARGQILLSAQRAYQVISDAGKLNWVFCASAGGSSECR
jgi:hypothetical protein